MHDKHDLFTEAFALQLTYIQSLKFQLLTDLEIFAFCFPAISNNLKSLKIIKNRRNEKVKYQRISKHVKTTTTYETILPIQ